MISTIVKFYSVFWEVHPRLTRDSAKDVMTDFIVAERKQWENNNY